MLIKFKHNLKKKKKKHATTKKINHTRTHDEKDPLKGQIYYYKIDRECSSCPKLELTINLKNTIIPL